MQDRFHFPPALRRLKHVIAERLPVDLPFCVDEPAAIALKQRRMARFFRPEQLRVDLIAVKDRDARFLQDSDHAGLACAHHPAQGDLLHLLF